MGVVKALALKVIVEAFKKIRVVALQMIVGTKKEEGILLVVGQLKLGCQMVEDRKR